MLNFDGMQTVWDQGMLFNEQGARIITNAIKGFNCCLFAYGQTGSGKTYSVLGGEQYYSEKD